MNCEQANISMQLALDAELSVSDEQALESHLDGCLECRRMAAWLHELHDNYPKIVVQENDLAETVVLALKQSGSKEIRSKTQDSFYVPDKTGQNDKKSRLRTIGRLILRKRGEGKAPKDKDPSWTSTAVDSMILSFKTLAPAIQPAIAGQSHALGWMRFATGHIRVRPW